MIDLEQFADSSITEVRKELVLMSTSRHKNIVEEYTSFVEHQFLWIVMPLIDAGSCLDIMRLTIRRGRGIEDEATIATILKYSLEALAYFHQNQHLHRDIKSGNILLDQQGRVYLADFGVSATLKKGQKRGTFVGSPCWMAPEVMNF